MMIKSKKFFLLVLGGVIIVCGYLVITKSYPIAFVNWRPISLGILEKDYGFAIYYYKKALEIYSKDSSVIDSGEAKREIKRAVLDKLIEDSLIQQELEKRLKSNDVKKMVDNKIGESLKETDINKKVETLYGLSLDDFRKRILEPQAKQEIFEARLSLENKNFSEWQKEARGQAKVMIFLPEFGWKDDQVIVK